MFEYAAGTALGVLIAATVLVGAAWWWFAFNDPEKRRYAVQARLVVIVALAFASSFIVYPYVLESYRTHMVRQAETSRLTREVNQCTTNKHEWLVAVRQPVVDGSGGLSEYSESSDSSQRAYRRLRACARIGGVSTAELEAAVVEQKSKQAEFDAPHLARQKAEHEETIRRLFQGKK